MILYKEKYHLKYLENSDFSALQFLFKKVFQKKVSVDFLINKYNSTYLKLPHIATIAYCENIPVAFYGAIPQKFTNTNESVFIAHACDSITLKEHQRKGLHFELAKLSYKRMQELEIQFVYAFHSENTFLSTQKLGWKNRNHLARFHFKIKTIPLAKVLNKLKLNFIYKLFLNSSLTNKKLQKFNKKPTTYLQNKSADFFEYKNSFSNHYFIEICNCLFWIKIEGIMKVGLVTISNQNDFNKAIKKLKSKCFFSGINEILFQVDANSEEYFALKKLEKPQQSWPLGYLLFNKECEIKNFRFSYSDLDTF